MQLRTRYRPRFGLHVEVRSGGGFDYRVGLGAGPRLCQIQPLLAAAAAQFRLWVIGSTTAAAHGLLVPPVNLAPWCTPCYYRRLSPYQQRTRKPGTPARVLILS